MRDAVKSYLSLAGGLTDLTRQRAVAAARALASQGEATAEQVSALAEDLLAQSKQNREAIVSLVVFEVDRALARVGLAPAEEVTQLTERVHILEAQLRDLRATAGPAARGTATQGTGGGTAGEGTTERGTAAAPDSAGEP